MATVALQRPFFTLGQVGTTCILFYYMDSPITLCSPTDLKYQKCISLVFVLAQNLAHQQLTIARCHGVTDVSV